LSAQYQTLDVVFDWPLEDELETDETELFLVPPDVRLLMPSTPLFWGDWRHPPFDIVAATAAAAAACCCIVPASRWLRTGSRGIRDSPGAAIWDDVLSSWLLFVVALLCSTAGDVEELVDSTFLSLSDRCFVPKSLNFSSIDDGLLLLLRAGVAGATGVGDGLLWPPASGTTRPTLDNGCRLDLGRALFTFGTAFISVQQTWYREIYVNNERCQYKTHGVHIILNNKNKNMPTSKTTLDTLYMYH
jgi:hypothetical protein